MLSFTVVAPGQNRADKDLDSAPDIIDPERDAFFIDEKTGKIIGRVRVVHVQGGKAKIGFDFPQSTKILRGSILDLDTFSRVEENMMKTGKAYDKE